ncbi:MAG: DUF4835 family protein [Bacteroidetes bacterium]|nr:DUF4835 family protein [Bacteroidota bacterium]
MMKVRIFIFAIISLLAIGANAQELNCQISIMTPQIQASDKSIYDKLQTDLRDFMNNRKWTSDEFLNQERIECSFVITISDRPSTDEFKANIQIQSRRPVYKSSYNTPMFNHQDNNFTFKYVQDQLIEFDESNISSNLTAVLAYYAYIVIGLDYDSFSPEGGSPYFAKAQTIVNNAQSLPDIGWRAFESTRNRYWLVENLMNVSFKPLRNFIYTYHRQGFDKFSDNITDSRMAVTESMKDLRKVYQDKPNSFLMQAFFTAKVDEIINLYSQATSNEKNDVIQILSLVDPANTLKYQGIMTTTPAAGGGK